ncbi:hypothetical protein H310_11476 [Aphanomyces invadans]|uniref:Reverse transcriptase zinc-binding domain-containing protein n=1 Tax=Aphanomyces invadans TaxID=157072 RepID=A0A024TN72_9STRA|nr:hypothetical protein H310_11476 [Aphanomyces invadans]ETV94802.1 hypothetical protein H310_11476 [Aphanomyces invadans]|eukprot:XP_008876393.1 hypothetical protein H310_11476 [Aphanomyces invadans]
MDILYLRLQQPVKYGLGHYGRILGPYLHQIFSTWSEVILPPPLTTMHSLDLHHIPLWVAAGCTTAQRPLRSLTRTAHLFTTLNYPILRLWDVIQGDSDISHAFTEMLHWLAPSRTAAAAGPAVTTHLQPLFTRFRHVSSAPTSKSINMLPTTTGRSIPRPWNLPRPSPYVKDFTRPRAQLSLYQDLAYIGRFIGTAWQREISMDKSLLPVFRDVRFRLHHNALGFLYKYAWRSGSTTCVHGCNSTEDAKHLFWDCPQAQRVWQYYLAPFEDISGKLHWQDILFTDSISIKTEHKTTYQDSFFSLLRFIQAICFRQLWLQRNLLLYDEAFPDSLALGAEAQAYLWLHIQAYLKRIEGPDKRKLHRFCSQLLHGGPHYQAFLPDTTYLHRTA